MHDIVHELDISASPARVFEAVTTTAGLASWWASGAEASGTGVGSELTLRFGDDNAVVLRVDMLEAPELAHYTCTEGPEEWPGTEIAFRIEGTDSTSTLRFWHGNWKYEDGTLPRSSFAWAMSLDALRRHLEAAGG